MISINKLFDEAEKIWPKKYAIRTFLVLFIFFSIIGLTSYFIEKYNRHKKMNAFEIKGRIEKIIKAERVFFYNVNGYWYGVQSEMNYFVEENDSLFKERETNLIILYRQNIKFKEFKASQTKIREVHENDKLLKQFERTIIERQNNN